MNRYLHIHPENPQLRLIKQVVDIIDQGGVIAYPTDSGYALGCHIGDKFAMETICKIRQVDKQHNFTLMCRDLSEIATYAKVGNSEYRLLKSLTPGRFTFILPATREVPRRLQNPKRKTIGIRIPENKIALMLLETLGQPLMTSTLLLPEQQMAMSDPDEIYEKLGNRLTLVVDGGICPQDPTTVVDLVEDIPQVIRQGGGDISWLNA